MTCRVHRHGRWIMRRAVLDAARAALLVICATGGASRADDEVGKVPASYSTDGGKSWHPGAAPTGSGGGGGSQGSSSDDAPQTKPSERTSPYAHTHYERDGKIWPDFGYEFVS